MNPRNPRKPLLAVLLFSFIFLLNSCFGVNAGIVLNQNGSGIVTLEYRVSKAMDSLGRLDGNERWNTIPVGKADFERTLARLPDMKLVSFSSSEDERNLICTAKMEFTNLNGLLAFLDAGGSRSSLTGDAQSGRMVLGFGGGQGIKNAGLDKLLASVSEGYTVKMSMTFPAEGSLALTDHEGKPLQSGGDIVAKGKTVSFSLPLYEILSSPGGINAEFGW